MRGPERSVQTDLEPCDGGGVRPGASAQQVGQGAVIDLGQIRDRSKRPRGHRLGDSKGEEPDLLGGRVYARSIRPVAATRGGRVSSGAGHGDNVDPRTAKRQPGESVWFAVGMNQHQVSNPSVETVVAGYTPRQINLYHWLKVRSFVQEAVLGSAPPSPDEARRRMTIVAGLVAWGHVQAGYDLDRRVFFDLDVIAEWIDQECGQYSDKVRKMYRARLKAMAKLLNPDFPEDAPEETSYASAWSPNPYSDAEMADLEGWARSQRTAGRRNKAQVLLALTRGAGLYSHEVVRLRISDIQIDEYGVLLHIRGDAPRDVPVSREWEQTLIGLVAAVRPIAPDAYAFSPGRTNRKTTVIQNFVKSTNRNPGISPHPQRLRATWMVNLIKAGVPPAALAKAAGLTNLRSYERWLYAYPEVDTTEYRNLMRDTWREAKRRNKKGVIES